jgi:hypothetical protein
MIFVMEILLLHEGNISLNIQIGEDLTNMCLKLHYSLRETAILMHTFAMKDT